MAIDSSKVLLNSTLLLGAGDGLTELVAIARLDLAPLTAEGSAAAQYDQLLKKG